MLTGAKIHRLMSYLQTAGETDIFNEINGRSAYGF